MRPVQSKNLRSPDERVEFPGVVVDQVDLGDLTVGHTRAEPGWRWSTHVRPHVGTEWCEARHIGVVLSGRLGGVMRDGTPFEFGPYDVMEIPPGHDGWVVGDEAFVSIEWGGLRSFAGNRAGSGGRALTTLLFTDVVDSTRLARDLGDVAWRELLSHHYEAARAALDRFGGQEVATTGDGMLASFDGPAQALSAASRIRAAARREGIEIRAAVHVGEVELVGADVRGVAVHEAARIMSKAGADEILVSDITRALAGPAGLAFEPRGAHELKGFDGEHPLFAFVERGEVAPA